MKKKKNSLKSIKLGIRKVGVGTAKAYKKAKPIVKSGYAIGKTTVQVVKKEMGIKKSKKKKRWATPSEFNRAFTGY